MNRLMKDSGIPWIGEIPSHWLLYRIKYNTFLKGRIGWQGLNSNDFLDEGYCLITGTDFDNKGGIHWETCYRISKERFDEDELLHVKEGDLLMTKDGTVGKMALIKALPEEASLNSHLLIIRQLSSLVSNPFLYWVMVSDIFNGFVSYFQTGTIMSSISQTTLGYFSCFIPPTREQQAIYDFLDKKCSEIDELISLQEKFIEELKSYKQSVITEAVTKGLNPDVPMKDSEVDWLDNYPSHWREGKIQYVALLSSGTNLTTEQITETGEYPVFGGNGCRGYYSSYNNEGEYVLIGRQGALCGNINLSYGKFWATEHAIVCYPKTNYSVHWFGYLLYSMNLNQYSLASAQPGLSVERIKQLFIPIPPVAEQQSIADYLDKKCEEIDSLISLKQSKIEQLKEYKKSIIYEYVTGKKEVEA